MKTAKDNIVIKKSLPAMFSEIVVSDDVKKQHDSPANRSKVEKAKKILANFGYK